MSREHLGLPRQLGKLFTQTVHKCIVVAARKVGASYASAEEGIAAEKHIVILAVKADRSW